MDNEIIREINSILDKPYSFIKAIQMKETSSHRMMIQEVSPHLS